MRPYLLKFNLRMGRPSVAVDMFHRLMYLRFRYDLSYERLVQAVSDSIVWRQFCRIPLGAKAPDSTTLVKLVKKYGPELLDELNRQLVDKAREKKIVRGRKLRVDTTVVESDIDYPTDADLMWDGVKALTRAVKQLRRAGAVTAKRFRDHTRGVKKHMLGIAKVLQRRSGENRAEVLRITGEIVKVTKRAVTTAKAVIYEATEHGAGAAGRAVKATLNKLRRVADLSERVIRQTEQVLSGDRHVADRIVSLVDADARPIRKRKLKAPTEFGYKVVIQESEKRLITGYEVLKGNPADGGTLRSTMERHEQAFGRAPLEVAADRGFSTPENERLLEQHGVERAAIPRRGKLGPERKAYQGQRWFRRLQRWRAGSESTISLLKRRHGMRRSRMRGYDSARTWVASAVFAHNLCTLATI